MFTRRTVALALISLLPLTAIKPAAGQAPANSATDAVVRDLCGKTVALLGEAPMHGYGRTLQFKVELVRRLVDECHFNAFFIESGVYDFVNIQKKLASRQPVTEAMVAAAIGGVWANRDVEPLVPFLLERARKGTLVLGGLDDQIGRGSYAQLGMPADLVASLQADKKTQCLATLQKHTLWQYTNDAPYSPNDRSLIISCLDQVKTSEDLVNVESLKRSFARDFRDDGKTGAEAAIEGFNGRDQSMYLNFKWLMSKLPPPSKVIVWTATNHAAKDLSGVPGQEKTVSLGSYIHRDFNNAFVLGISAASGSYAMGRQPARQLSVAPSGSIESQAFATEATDMRYFDTGQLRKFGAIAARPLGADFKTATWDAVLDGLVVIREERPPTIVK